MQCGNCGATIAEKAIVCYRCGTPTAVPPPARPTGGASGRRPMWAVVLLVVVAVVLGGLAAVAERASTAQIALAVGAVVMLLAGLGLVRRR